MWNVDWGKIVKDARMDYGMTQEELAEKLKTKKRLS